jgi:endonuclease/exonuclease/phosphatase (EEP) superfamily protein YafD
MARRPENPRDRGRRSESPLSWLNQLDADTPEEPEAAPPVPAAPTPYNPAPYSPTPYSPQAEAPAPIPLRPQAQGSAQGSAQPKPSPPPTLSRREARAQREAAQNAALQNTAIRGGGPPPGGAWPTEDQAPSTGAFNRPAFDRADRHPADRHPADRQAVDEEPPWPTPTTAKAPSTRAHNVSNRHRPRDDEEHDAEPEAPRRGRRKVFAGLFLASLLLALWSATTFIDSGNFMIAGLAALSPLITVCALPVIAVGVGSKHLVPTVIAVLAALLPWTLVAGYAAAGPGRNTVGTDSTLRVMSVDGAQGAASAKDIVQTARTYSVDIVVVTELTSELAHQLTVAGLNSLAPARWVSVPTSGSNGTGVWSGQPIDGLKPITELSRPGVDGAIEAGSSKLGITVVQLNGEPLHRAASWHSDLSKLAKRPATTKPGLIVGDLNATPWTPAFRTLTKADWRDAADVVGQGLRPTWPSWSPLPIAPLDHVMVSSGLGVTSAETTNIAGSDHRALIVTLVLPHAGG